MTAVPAVLLIGGLARRGVSTLMLTLFFSALVLVITQLARISLFWGNSDWPGF
jgi:hypothetical protein